MDSLIAAAARALVAGDALGALKRVSLREDPPALALRGIAMAQLGEHPRARELLRRAARGFGAHEDLAHARCVVAEAEVALAVRDLSGSPRTLAAAAATLEAHADRANALQARLISVRRLLLLGRLDEAASSLAAVSAGPLPSRLNAPSGGRERSELGGQPVSAGPPPSRLNAPSGSRERSEPGGESFDARGLSPSLQAVAELAAAELALRSLRTATAQAALHRAHEAAERARVPALFAEVAEARAALDRPAARRLHAGHEQLLRLPEVEALLASGTLVVDACRRGLRAGTTWLPLARRPVLFALARALAEAWPGDVDRDALIARAFRTRRPDETHRARLRVEIGRLRALAAPLSRIEATERGFKLLPLNAREVVVLLPPIDGDQASLLALLADGAAWSTSALALALGASQRTVQRALAELESAARVRSIGRTRAQRWLAPPLAGFTTILLLPAALPLT
jgi:hypothetical protein